MQMVFDEIEKLKQQYTDKYVVIEGDRPELARFKGATGRVKTVNMSGRALVEFDANNNIAWYDIALDFLKLVDKPLPKPAESHEKPAKKEAPAKPKAAAAPAAEKKLSPLEMARAQGAAQKAGEAPKKSTSDILAAARGGKAAAPAKAEAPAAPAGKPSTADILAAARAKKGTAAAAAPAKAPAAKPAPPAAKPAAAPQGKPSTAEILAAARAKKGAEAAAPAAVPVEAEEAPSAPAAKPKAAPAAGGLAAARNWSTADKIAWCRQHDAK